MIQQHGNLLQIHHHIQVKVEEQGDLAFAAVLGNCMATARGEHADGDTRPFHKLLL